MLYPRPLQLGARHARLTDAFSAVLEYRQALMDRWAQHIMVDADASPYAAQLHAYAFSSHIGFRGTYIRRLIMLLMQILPFSMVHAGRLARQSPGSLPMVKVIGYALTFTARA